MFKILQSLVKQRHYAITTVPLLGDFRAYQEVLLAGSQQERYPTKDILSSLAILRDSLAGMEFECFWTPRQNFGGGLEVNLNDISMILIVIIASSVSWMVIIREFQNHEERVRDESSRMDQMSNFEWTITSSIGRKHLMASLCFCSGTWIQFVHKWYVFTLTR